MSDETRFVHAGGTESIHRLEDRSTPGFLHAPGGSAASTNAAIDGTGWVRQPFDGDRLTATGQVFRMAMYHENHPDKDYKMANQVETFDEPRAIAWKPGTESSETGELSFGGWIWRYDLEANGASQTTVTLTYDWSAVPARIREHIGFPPFGPDHLDNSLRHLSDLVTASA